MTSEMDYYHTFAAICCLLAVLNVYGTVGLVMQWMRVEVDTRSPNAVVSTPLFTPAGSVDTWMASITVRDDENGFLFTVEAMVLGTGTTYTLDTESLSTFYIATVEGGGEITIQSGKRLLYATQSTYTVYVTATDLDDGGTSVLTLSVIVNGMPTFSPAPICLNIAHGTKAGTTLFTYTIADPEGTEVTSVLDDVFASAYLTYQAGNLITNTEMNVAASDGPFSFVIRATDSGNPPSTSSTKVYVIVTDEGTGTGTCCLEKTGTTVTTGTGTTGTTVVDSAMKRLTMLVTYFV